MSGSTYREITVRGNDAASTIFVVRPVAVGEFDITVAAGRVRNITEADDIVKKKLRVVVSPKLFVMGQ